MPFVESTIASTGPLALDGLAPWLNGLWQKRRVLLVCGLSLMTLVVVFMHTLAIAVMQHEVKMGQVRQTLNVLDDRYGKDQYTLLTAWTFSDFLYLRFTYPDRPIYTAHTVEKMNKDRLSDELMRSSQEMYFPERAVETREQLARTGDRPLVLFGFHYNFAAENLRAIFDRVPGRPLEAQLAKMNLADHLATTWLWEHPDYQLDEVVRVGHYRAFEVRPGVEPVEPEADEAGQLQDGSR